MTLFSATPLEQTYGVFLITVAGRSPPLSIDVFLTGSRSDDNPFRMPFGTCTVFTSRRFSLEPTSICPSALSHIPPTPPFSRWTFLISSSKTFRGTKRLFHMIESGSLFDSFPSDSSPAFPLGFFFSEEANPLRVHDCTDHPTSLPSSVFFN